MPSDSEPRRKILAREYDTLPPTSQVESSPTVLLRDQYVGRYRIEALLGKGGFGAVYLARDEQLNRSVAVKVPHAELITKQADAEAYMAEARTVANLDHPAIVPVHDVGSTESYPCFIVSKYIPGTDLATKLSQQRFSFYESAELVATVADALHYAHKQGLVHRDVKPGNILFGEDQRPYLVDFGLALREQDFGVGLQYAGTPAYMSPEQARGEGHRVDGRSDIYSLGAVLYEMLAGRRTVSTQQRRELFERIAGQDVKPPRQVNDQIPREIERICLRALAKRTSDRYTTALDMAEDLRHWLSTESHVASKETVGLIDRIPISASTDGHEGRGSEKNSDNQPAFDSQPLRIVPKGLRAFDNYDADFYLELLPGPRDRDGLPASIRFWRSRIETSDPENTFAVGLIYGPSGCGKSSMIRAGLLPRLSTEVHAIYLEATSTETENHLLSKLQKRFPELDPRWSLRETLAALRRGQALPSGEKVLLVLDQFEQWLHGNQSSKATELVQALRQCDGIRVQCIVMVRDDFWLAVSRFGTALEIDFLPGVNASLMDLFDIDHAATVLAAYGRAFGRLPTEARQISKEQKKFIKQAIIGLAEDGKVICVRIALFAEMLKGREWTQATLKDVGGPDGVGVAFLEEAFCSPLAAPRHRMVQTEARAVLKALLPAPGSAIKGHMQSFEDLLQISGCSNRRKDFEDLIHILDNQLRLITPKDPEGSILEPHQLVVNPELPSAASDASKHYQLTHDYLVHPLREWLTQKQKETRKGRAELKLRDASLGWNGRRENRFLPSLMDWLTIRMLTDQKRWTEPQRSMVRCADRFYLSRLVAFLIVFALLTATGVSMQHHAQGERRRVQMEGLVRTLVSAQPEQLTAIIQELNSNANDCDVLLRPLALDAAQGTSKGHSQLHASIALVSRDPQFIQPLVEQLLSGKPQYIGPICQQLQSLPRPRVQELTEQLGTVFGNERELASRRFHAGLAIALSKTWQGNSAWSEQELEFVVRQLASANPETQPLLRQYLRPVMEQLLPRIKRLFSDPTATDAQRLSAANAIADHLRDDVKELTTLVTLATPEQFAALYPLVAEKQSQISINNLAAVAATLPSPELSTQESISFGRRRAMAALTLLKLGNNESVLPVFAMRDDPEAISQFVFLCRPCEVRIEPLLDLFEKVTANVAHYPKDSRYGLLLALGEFELGDVPSSVRNQVLESLTNLYASDPDSGIHGAAGWLLRQWGQESIVRAIDETALPYTKDREWFTIAISVDGSKEFFYTFIVFPPGEYVIGSLADELDREKGENQRVVDLTRPFAILDREVTFEELLAFGTHYQPYMQQFDARPHDAGFGVDWYDSASFCRWLGQQMGISEDEQAYSDPDQLSPEKYPREPSPLADWAPRDWPLELKRRGFRLPTSAEWEVACRAGARTRYGHGGEVDFLDRFSWYADNSMRTVHPPKSLRPSRRGLFDMTGNLLEWTHDWSDDVGENGSIDPMGPASGSFRIRRGGAYEADAFVCRTAKISNFEPTFRARNSGLRIALTLPTTPPADAPAP